MLAYARMESLGVVRGGRLTFAGPLRSKRCVVPADRWWGGSAAVRSPHGGPCALPALCCLDDDGEAALVLVIRPAGADLAEVMEREPAALRGRRALVAWLEGGDPARFARPARAGTWVRETAREHAQAKSA